MTCGACPSQWEACTEDRRPVYVRYRWGYLSIRIGPQNADGFDEAVDGEEIFGKVIDESGWGGCLSFEELKTETAGVIEWPAYESQEEVWPPRD